MAKNIAFALGLLLVVSLFVTCGERKAPEEKLAPGMELMAKLEARMLTEETGYAIGDRVELQMEIKNISAESVNLEFPTHQRYDFFVFKKGDLVWRWSHNKPFEETPDRAKLSPGESLAFTEMWDTQKLPPREAGGRYQVVGVLTTDFPIATNFIEIGLTD